MYRYVLVALALAGSPVLAQNTPAAAPAPAQALPGDPRVTIGTLPNGLKYYIRQNSKPEKRAELRLVVKAGSILEDDDQLGLAHFVEHTAFNGTTNFKKNEMLNYLESIGVQFGADLNASTGFDETVYILPVPTDSAHIIAKAFQILEDWAHGQIFDATEVTNERGIVVEEWRGRKGAGDRMLQKWLPVVLKGSRYATRLPIGTQESILGATPAKLRRFYQDWYRPDNMAVIAVGDFDPARIEAQIKQHFTGIARRPNARPRPAADVPDNVAPLVAIVTDPEATSSSVNLTFKLPVEETRTVGDYRRGLTERLYLAMLNNRFFEMTQKADAPFTGAGGSKGAFFAGRKDAFTLGAGAKEGQIERAAEALITEARRVDQFGFLESELSRAKQNLLRGYERAFAERNNTQSAAFVEEYIGNFLEAEAIPGIEYENTLAQQLVPAITLGEVNTLARRWITDENRVILVQAPEKAGLKVPSESELLAVFEKATRAPVVAYTEAVSEEPLIERLPAPGRVTAERAITGVNVTEWRLSNGARVLFKPTDFKADEILFSAYSAGGSSLVADADFLSATYASAIMQRSGLGKFNQIDLGKKLAGKAIRVGTSIGASSEGLSGSASPRDLETLFQLIHLSFTAPRLDTAAFQAFKSQAMNVLANRGSSPEAVFSDTIGVTMSQHHFRSRPPTVPTFNEVNPQRALEIYKDRFADAGDFTFLFVGNVDAAALKPLVERYLATLPATGRKETWKDIGMTSPKGVVEKVVRKGTEPKASTLLWFNGPIQFTPENRFALRALTDLFQIKLNESLRERLGGTYSPSVNSGASRIPRPEYVIQIGYGSAPDNVESLTQSVLALIDTLKTNGPAAADVEKVREQMIRAREVDLKTNAYWVANLAGRDQNSEDPAGLLAPFDELVKKLNAAQIQQAARQYFDTKNYARFLLLPENKQ